MRRTLYHLRCHLQSTESWNKTFNTFILSQRMKGKHLSRMGVYAHRGQERIGQYADINRPEFVNMLSPHR